MLDLTEIRRELHRIPELAFEELQTSDKLFEKITKLLEGRADAEITRYRTGIIVHLPAGETPSDAGDVASDAASEGTSGKTIGWRADMDALPIAERTGLPFASAHAGAMHACGHDVHMACALGILERISARPRRNGFVFLFQPAEENIGGAREIYDAGLLDKYRISEFYALHVSPAWDAGVIATRPGTLLAGSSSVTVEFTGVPGHAAMPHEAVDPIVSVASFVLQIQAMIARNFDPATAGVVLTFGTINGGTVVNGVAASAKVMGSLRFIHDAQRELAFRRIREIADGVALATGATADVRLTETPWVPLVNDPVITAKFSEYVRNRADATFADAPLTMASEDFGYLVTRIPGMMFWLGVGGGHPLHSDQFAPDEAVIAPAARLVADYLSQL
jgi:N-acetyldiaminopimelate deacetylase